MMVRIISFLFSIMIVASCGTGGSRPQTTNSGTSMEKTYQVKLITVDPGHFHAALVQKIMYDQISPEVHVYAPQGPDYLQHLDRIKSYNTRPVNPTFWNEIVYTGPDFFEKMLADKAGNVVVLSGNNRKKAEYITKSINAGINVLADKPMIISPEDFPVLEAAFTTAKEKGVLLYDIMTERYEAATIISKEEFKGVTGIDDFPAYLLEDVKDGKLNVFANGEMVYRIKGIFAKVSVEWKYQAPPGGGDTHYSIMHGTKCDLIIRQGAEEDFLPTLYIENIKGLTMNDFI